MKKFAFLGLAVILIVTYALFTFSTDPNIAPQTNEPETLPHLTYFPQLPDSMSFADEEVPLDRIDVYESFDREIITNTFWHTNLILILKRSARYFPIIEPILRECGVPDDFKYLCVAESSLVPTAKSPAGAVGLWQILETTGKELGLEINDEVDERYDIQKSTRAACKFLLRAKNTYNWSWTLLAASYNGGQNRVAKNASQQQQSNYYDMLWGEETGRYVFRILAFKTLMSNPQAYGFMVDENDYYKPYECEEIVVNQGIEDIAQWAIDHGTTYKALKMLNPWLRKNKLTNTRRKEYTILVAKF